MSRGPRKANKRPGRARLPSGAQPRPAGPAAASLTGTEALTAPAPRACGGRRPRSCCRQSAAKRRPQLGPSARALAPPIVKGPAGGSAYKASARAHAAPPLPISSRDTAGSPPSRPIGGRAGPRCNAGRGLACPGRARGGPRDPRDPALRAVGAPTTPTAKPARGVGRDRKGAPENDNAGHPSGDQSGRAAHLPRTSDGSPPPAGSGPCGSAARLTPRGVGAARSSHVTAAPASYGLLRGLSVPADVLWSLQSP